MRKYLKPAIEMEAFDVENVIRADLSANPNEIPEDDNLGTDAPIIVDFN